MKAKLWPALAALAPPGQAAKAAVALHRRMAAAGRDRGALTLEWIVIAAFLVAGAVAASLIFKAELSRWISQLTSAGG